MLLGVPVRNWFMEYRRLGLLEHHETSVGMSFVRVLFEFGRDGHVLPCNGLFKRVVIRYKGKILTYGYITYGFGIAFLIFITF